MPVEITGGTESNRAMARRAYDRVIEALPFEGTVPIRVLGLVHGLFSPLPSGVEARSTPSGVEIAATAIWKGPPGRPEYLLYEEIAHHIAGEQGLPHDGNAGVFLQELFAGFVKFTLAQEHHSQLSSDLSIPEIGATGWQRFYGFGTDLGALVAGMQLVGSSRMRWSHCRSGRAARN